MLKTLLNMAVAALTAHQVVSGAWSRGLKPPPSLTVSEWAARYRIVTAPSPDPGPWRNERTPYLVGIMDALSPSHPAREVDFMKGTQIGGTEAAVNVVGYYSHQSPNSGLIVLPSKDVAREWSTLRFQGLFENTPVLQPLFSLENNRRRAKSNTTYAKRLANGCSWKMAWSSSGKILRSTPAAIIIADEVDGFVLSVGGGKRSEGEPIDILTKRYANFRRGKFLRISSPTDRSGSRIERGFRAGDQRYYFLPCPHCAHFQRLVFERIRWPQGEPQKAAYECAACEKSIPEYHKTAMLARGMWVATADHPDLVEHGFPDSDIALLQPILDAMAEAEHVSFHLSALYSPLGWYSWSTLASDWEKIHGDAERLKVFVMTTLGETWVDRGEAPDNQRLFERRESYEIGIVPRGGLFLTAGADVQADRIEVEVVAWGYGKESWSVGYEVLPGDTSTPAPWNQLEQLLARDWPCAVGGSKPIIALAIDTGFRPQMGYAFARRHQQAAHGPAGSRIVAVRTVIPIKGTDDWQKLIVRVSNPDAAKKRGGIRIVEVGTACAKQELYDWLRLPAPSQPGETYPPGYCHFPSYEKSYFQGLCSESRVIRATGRPEWVKDPSVRNEPLDVRVYARAAAAVYGLDVFRQSKWKEMGWNPEVVSAVTAAPASADTVQQPQSVVVPPVVAAAIVRKRRPLVRGYFAL